MVNVFKMFLHVAPRCLNGLQVFFLTRLNFSKTPADLWKDTRHHKVASDSWLNLQH